MRLSESMANDILETFRARLDPEERSGIGKTVNVTGVNRDLERVGDPDPEDVAQAIWESVEGMEDFLEEDHRLELVDLVEDRWEQLRRGHA
jgi:hypothetical protein